MDIDQVKARVASILDIELSEVHRFMEAFALAYTELHIEPGIGKPEVWLSYYCHMRSKRDAWRSNNKHSYATRDAGIREHEEKMQYAINQLDSLGFRPEKIKNKWQLVLIQYPHL